MSKAAPPTWRAAGGGPPQVQQQPAAAAAITQSQWRNQPQQQAPAAQQSYGGDDSDNETGTNLPQAVAVYLSDLYQAMVDNDVASVRYLYYKGWRDITRSYYAESEWPAADQVAPLCDENEVFLLCYRELCNRHICMNGKPSLAQRFESWANYRDLFDMFLDGATTSKLLLPLEWLNDMIDEFLYQWQDFAANRHMRNKSESEIEMLRENPNVWKVQTVLGYLTSFVERSQIARDLSSAQFTAQQQAQQPQQPQQVVQYSILKALGAFSLVGLCRAQVLLADYRYALRVLDPVDIDDQRAIFTQITPCAITLFYNLGFAYLMSRRYADALQVFSRVLISHKTSRDSASSFAEEQIQSRYDKIVALAGICQAMSPGLRVDEQVKRMIGDKFEKLGNVQNAKTITDETLHVFEELFSFACPKFVNLATPSNLLPKKDGEDVSVVPVIGKDNLDPRRELHRVQLKWFLEDARQQLSLPTIRSFLKLYKSIPIDKLSRFCQTDMDQFRQNLMFIKARSSQVVRGISDGSAPIDGIRTSVSDVHFYVVGDKNPANDMVHIVADISTVRQQNNAKFFATNALKFQNAINDLQREVESPEDPRNGSLEDNN
jgi:translation initiation factor 3 subunit L